MPLWTPYAEAPLDLTLPSTSTIKSEPESPPAQINVEDSFDFYNHGSYNYAMPPYVVPPSYMEQALPSPPISNSVSPPSVYASSHELYDMQSLSDDEEYKAFKKDALDAMAMKNGGCVVGSNPRMRRAVQTSEAEHEDYRKRRERNNLAAKMSRDRRKVREMLLSIKVSYLTKKRAELKALLAQGLCTRCRQN